MQKALTKMNVQLANVISDISGVSGQAIIGAILEGERDPYKLADLRDGRVHASREEIARSVEGSWREDLLFELKQALDAYKFAHRQMDECDVRLEQYLNALPTRRIAGVDLTSIDGIDVMTAQAILAEVGPDLTAFKNEDHFASWLGLTPDNDITGGKVIRRGSRKVKNRAGQALHSRHHFKN